MRVLLAPMWARTLVWGSLAVAVLLLAGTVMTSEHRTPMVLDWPWGTLIFAFLSVMAAAFLTWHTDRNSDRYLSQVQGLSQPQRSAAVRAMFGGPVPADPAVVVAALRLGRVYLDRAVRYRLRTFLVLGVALTLLALLLATALRDGNVWASAYTVVVMILAPGATWWWQMQVRDVDAQHRFLTEARRYHPEKRI